MNRIQVRHGSTSYPALVGAGAREHVAALVQEHAPAHRVLVIADATVSAAWPDILPDWPRLLVAGGEAAKTRDTWQQLTDQMLSSGADRRTLIVALGGGVTTDLAGFVAATYQRGIPWIAVPTTTLAMCDAAIGGKTGVDTPLGKNLVGAFHQPRAVVADTDLLSSLPDPIYRSGLAEAVKHAAIHDAAHWRWLEHQADQILARDTTALGCLIADSIRIKAAVVAADEREAGRRAILNAGHTLGHALEQASDYQLSHGDAVALGLLLEARIGEALGVTTPGTAQQIASLHQRFGLPILLPDRIDRDRVHAAMQHDKKNRDGQIHAALLARIGSVAGSDATGWTTPLALDLIDSVL